MFIGHRMKRLELVFQPLAENGLKIEGSKCNFFQKCVSFLKHIISESGFKVDPEKVRAVERIKGPSSLKTSGPSRPCGLLSKIFPSFGKTAETLYSLLNNSKKFDWSTEGKRAVTEL